MRSNFKRSEKIAWDDYPIKAKNATARRVIRRYHEKELRQKSKAIIEKEEV